MELKKGIFCIGGILTVAVIATFYRSYLSSSLETGTKLSIRAKDDAGVTGRPPLARPNTKSAPESTSDTVKSHWGMTEEDYHFAIFEHTDAASFLTALTLVRKHIKDPIEKLSQSVSRVSSFVSRASPEEVKKLLKTMDLDQYYVTAGNSWVKRIAKTDPTEAIAWIEDVSGTYKSGDFITTAGEALTGVQASMILPHLQKGKFTSEDFGRLMGLVYAKAGEVEQSQIFQKVVDDARLSKVEKRECWKALAGSLSLNDTNAAALISVPEIAGNANTAGPVSTYFGRWASQQPESVAGFVASRSDSPVAGAMTTELVRQWFHLEPKQTSIWLNSLPQGPAREDGAAELARLLIRDTPEDALPWIDQIADKARREQLSQQAIAAISKNNSK